MANTSTANLRSRIEEDHLTCSICYNVFTKPKALPCIHTFCELCLRDYVVSRGYEAAGEFPCPICRETVKIPVGGLQQLPANHMVNSLSETVDNKPKPKPRRSLQPAATERVETAGDQPQAQTTLPTQPAMEEKPPLPDNGINPAAAAGYGGDREGIQNYPTPHSHFPPPQHASHHYGGHPPPNYPPPPYYQAAGKYPYHVPSPNNAPGGLWLQDMVISGATNANPQDYPAAPLYPTVPPPPVEGTTPCSERLQLRFGKKGASVTDFQKPFGLAVSDNCDFVVTDLGVNRIFVFDYQGQPKKAFHCDCRIKDVAVNSKNEIVVVVNKPGVALRCFDMSGKFLGEHGRFITHEETQGISLLWNGGAVVTGIQNHSVYILTDQFKQSSKFGRKGTGDGYFLSPAFITSDSKSHIIVSDDANHNVQVFNKEGKFKVRFGGRGSSQNQLLSPKGVTTDADDNIIVADSGNNRVQMFNPRGVYLRTIVSGTHQLGEDVRPVNVAMTPRGNIAVLLNGPYFAEVRVYGAAGCSSIGPSSRDCLAHLKRLQEKRARWRRPPTP